MSNENWIKHLNQWLKFLELRSEQSFEKLEKIKIERQIYSLQNIRFGAVLNPKLLYKFITQQSDPIKAHEPDKRYFMDLNDSQKDAVDSALNAEHLLLIQGPPGTGKTQVITEICLELFVKDPSVRILLCSETHIAVNNLIKRVGDKNENIKMIRIADKRNDNDMSKCSFDVIKNAYYNSLNESHIKKSYQKIIKEIFDMEQNKKSTEKAFMQSANIVGITCNKVGAYDLGNDGIAFDYVIIDEICKAMLPEIIMPLTISNKAILVGDPKQLPPVFCQEDIHVINDLIEECDLQRYYFIDSFFENTENKVMLNRQYRMVNEIGNLISSLFYQNLLENGLDNPGKDSIVWINYIPSQIWPLDDAEIYNDDECKIAQKLVLEVEEEYQKGNITMAVISPYTNQIQRLRRSIHKTSANAVVEIDTVDGFQGREADIVIFCITRTRGSLRFFSDPRRLNVAISRAKKRLYLIGYAEFAKTNNVLNKIIKVAKLRNYYLRQDLEHQ
jgi:superfamily I DNA and/or RNA helicase